MAELQLFNPMMAYAKGQQDKFAIDQERRKNSLAELAMQREDTARNELANLVGDRYKGLAAADPGAAIKMMDYETQAAQSQQKAASEEQKQQMELAKQAYEISGHWLSTIKDPASYQMAAQGFISELRQRGFGEDVVQRFAGMIPQEYPGPEWVQSALQRNMAEKAKLDSGMAMIGGQAQYLPGVVEAQAQKAGEVAKAQAENRAPTELDFFRNNPEEYMKFKQAGKSSSPGSNGRPHVAQLFAEGWIPSGRITGPLLDQIEEAATYAERNNLPFGPDDIRAIEFNTARNITTGRSAGSRLSVARKQNIEAAFGLLDDIETTGNKLNYDNLRWTGELQKWKNGLTNDPVFTEYMTQRADALFVLGNALKQNGLTDKSIQVEEEAANPTMSPRALRAWLNTQRRALNRAAEEMNRDYKYDIETVPTVEAGIGGAGKKEDFSGFEIIGIEDANR